MGNNTCSGQLQGPFKAHQELFDLIQHNSERPVKYIKHLGVQTESGSCIMALQCRLS